MSDMSLEERVALLEAVVSEQIDAADEAREKADEIVENLEALDAESGRFRVGYMKDRDEDGDSYHMYTINDGPRWTSRIHVYGSEALRDRIID